MNPDEDFTAVTENTFPTDFKGCDGGDQCLHQISDH